MAARSHKRGAGLTDFVRDQDAAISDHDIWMRVD